MNFHMLSIIAFMCYSFYYDYLHYDQYSKTNLFFTYFLLTYHEEYFLLTYHEEYFELTLLLEDLSLFPFLIDNLFRIQPSAFSPELCLEEHDTESTLEDQDLQPK